MMLMALIVLSSFAYQDSRETYAITVDVNNLRSSSGVVLFTLYNQDGTIPDEHFEKYYKQLQSKIINKTATITFNNLPEGEYAINILHDEDEDGVIDKGWILPE